MKRFGRAAVLALAVALAGQAAEAASPKAAVRAWRAAHEKQIVADFSALLSMPNVATTLPDVEKNAAYISNLLQQRGFKTQLLTAEPGTPSSVFAELKTPGARRTVVFSVSCGPDVTATKARSTSLGCLVRMLMTAVIELGP